MRDELPPEDVPSTLPQGAAARPLDAEAMRRRIGARLFGEVEAPSYLDRFRVLRTLGVGGMGVVYAAEDDTLGRVVALKVIRDEGFDREEERARILREARALAKLSHPNIVQLHEVVTAPDGVFLVMEYVAGTTLLGWLRAERRSVDAIVAVFMAVGRGLGAAHRAGVVHRDIKPSNILIGDDGRVRIADFGLARGLAAAPGRSADPTPVDPVTPAAGADTTGAGALAGTPVYMAPEAFLGGRADARSDQFAFCVALYECVYGERPFGPDALPGHELLRRRLELPARIGRASVPRGVRRVLARGLAPRPADRFEAMDDLVAALERGPVLRRRWMSAAGAAALAGAAVLGGRLIADEPAPPPSPCPVAVSQLAGVWDAATRSAVRTAMLATDQPFAARAAARVEEGLDGYARRWLAAQRDACEATRVRGEQSEELRDASMVCLSRRRGALAALTWQLRRADGAAAAGAVDLVHALPRIDACRDPAALARGATQRPDDPRLDEAEANLVRAAVLLQARESGEARALIDRSLAAIQAVGDPYLEAEALLLRGTNRARELGEVDAGIADLHLAQVRAVEAGHHAVAWKSWKELADVAALVRLDPGEARRHLEHARAAAGRFGAAAPADAAGLLDSEGFVLSREEEFEEALARHREALALRSADLPEDHLELVWSRMRVADATATAGRVAEAVASLAALHGEVVDRFGAEHPAAALIEIAWAQQLVLLERPSEARPLLERARPLVLRVFGRRTRYLAILDVELAYVDVAEGARSAAIARLRGALQLVEAVLPPQHDLRVEILALLAALSVESGDMVGALDLHRALLVLHDEHGLELDLAPLLSNIGQSLCRLGRCADSVEYVSRLFELHEKSPPEQEAYRAFGLYGLAYGHLEAGHPELALLRLEQAHRLLRAEPEALPDLEVDVTRLLARCLEVLRRSPARVRALRAAADARARALGIP